MRHLCVREIMTEADLCERPPGASVRDACRAMAMRRCGSVLVTERGQLLGIFTDGDLLRRVLAPGLDPRLTLLVEVMTREPDSIEPEARIDDAIRRMHEFGYRHLPVVEHGRVLGILSLGDLSIEDLAAMHAEMETRRIVAERAW